jgi:hypothetical protein
MPHEELSEGCFWLTTGRPIEPAQLERIRSQGRESLCKFFLSRGLGEQSRYKLLRCFFPTSFREFRTLERRVAASVGETCTVFVPVLGEGTAVWRPVSAVRVEPGLFRLCGPMPEGECWEFRPNELVRCAVRMFSGGAQGLAVFQRAGEPGAPPDGPSTSL